MGSGLAQTMDQKKTSKLQAVGNGLGGSASATSLTLSNYTVPGIDGKMLPAIPLNLAIKSRPPTVAVIYKMKCMKSGRMKKYIHDIKINFDQYTAGQSLDKVDINKIVNEIIAKETVYLNPTYIGKHQVSRETFKFKLSS